MEEGANSTCNTAATDATADSGDQTKKTDSNSLDEDLQKRMDDFLNLINVDDFTSDDSDNEDQGKDTKDSESSSDEAVPNVCRLNLRFPVDNNNN